MIVEEIWAGTAVAATGEGATAKEETDGVGGAVAAVAAASVP